MQVIQRYAACQGVNGGLPRTGLFDVATEGPFVAGLESAENGSHMMMSPSSVPVAACWLPFMKVDTV